MATRNSLTAEILREVLKYDEQSGDFTWIKHFRNPRLYCSTAGYVAGDGYRRIGIERTYYKAHNLAWLYVYGEFPSKFLDHINNIPTDNRIQNLRIATQAENTTNRKWGEIAGTRGVWWNGRKGKVAGKWCSTITANGVRTYLGNHETQMAAAVAYDKAAIKLHGRFARLNYPEHPEVAPLLAGLKFDPCSHGNDHN